MPAPTDLWKAILASDPRLDETARVLEELRDGEVIGAELAPAGAHVLRALLIAGDPDPRERLLPPLVPLSEAASAEAPEDSFVDGLGLVTCATLLAAGGHGGDPAPVLARWIPTAVDAGPGLTDGERTSYALACAALRFDTALHELIGDPPMTFVPGADFGHDARAYARYVAAATAAGATADDIAPAWTSFVAAFPIRLETGGLRWTDLLFAGYGAYHRIAGYAPGEVLDAIHGFVREVAAA